MFSLRTFQRVGFVVALALAQPAIADSWRVVHAGNGETIEIDRASISRGVDGLTAWSRIRLDRRVAEGDASYDTIRAQNGYDCGKRRFTTLRRAYFLGERLVREEEIARRRANSIQVGSLDERLMNVACRNPDSEPAPMASPTPRREADAVANAERPTAMHADMRVAGETETARVFPVADANSTEKPKLIQLPQIDKAALAQAAAAQEGTLRADTKGSATAGKPPPAPSKPVTANAKPREIEALSEKRIRELHYANSGPPRAARKKAPAVQAAHDEPENPAASLHKHWSYEGDTGPAHWARLRPDYAACASGKRQAPIDIRDGVRVNLEAIRFDYKPMRFRIVDNGHTVQVNLGDGASLTVMGKRYALQQFHFHRPAEERVNGRVYDMSVHLVHRNDDGQLAVVAVLLEKGTEHPLIQTLLNNLPLEQDSEMAPEEAIDPSMLLPESRAYWTYMGSLTTPPCTEGVLWMVLKQPLQVASEQAAIFSRVFRNNARPVQPHHGRLIKESR